MRSSRSRATAVLSILLLLGGGRGVAQDAKPTIYDIDAARDASWARFDQRKQDIIASLKDGRITAGEAKRLIVEANETRFAAARQAGTIVEQETNALLDNALKARNKQIAAYTEKTGRPVGDKHPLRVGSVKNTGTPLSSSASRGIHGDQDLTFASEADRAAFVQSAREAGYTVEGHLGDGYVRIKELDIVAHGPTRVPASPLGPGARLQVHEQAQGHESFASRGNRWDYDLDMNAAGEKVGTAEWSGRDSLGAVADNIDKTAGHLRADPSVLKGRAVEDWTQNLAKGTQRAMEKAGKGEAALKAALQEATAIGDTTRAAQVSADLEFLTQLKGLKTNMDPMALGLVPVDASAAQAQQALRDFQQRCMQQFTESYKVGLVKNQQLIVEMDAEISRLIKTGQTGEASKLMAERGGIIDGAAQAVQQVAAHDGGQLLSEIARGERLVPAVHNGRRGYVNSVGEFLTDAEVRGASESVLADARRKLTSSEPPVSEAGAAAGGLSNFDRGMLGLGAVLSGWTGAQKELEDAQREGRPPSNLKAVLKGWAEMTGAPGGYALGKGASELSIREEIEYFDEMARRGEKPSVIANKIWTLGKTLCRVALGLSGVSSIWEGGSEFVKMLRAEVGSLEGPPGDVNALVRDRAPAFVAALHDDLERLRVWLPRIDEVSLQARAAIAAAAGQVSGLDRLHEEQWAIQRHAPNVADLCRSNQNKLAEITKLKGEVSSTFAEADARAREVLRSSGGVCDGLAHSSSATPPASWAGTQNAHERMNRLMDHATSAHHRAAALEDDFDKDASRILEGKRQSGDQRNLSAMPDSVEALLRTIEAAAEPVSQLQALTAELRGHAATLKRQANMLVDAKAEEDQAFGFMAEADRILDKVTAAGVEDLTRRVQGLAARAERELDEFIPDDRRQTTKSWAGVCPAPSRSPGVDDLAAQASHVGDAVNAALQAYARAHDCVVRTEGMASRPVAPTGAPAVPPVRPPVPPPASDKQAVWVLKSAVTAKAGNMESGTRGHGNWQSDAVTPSETQMSAHMMAAYGANLEWDWTFQASWSRPPTVLRAGQVFSIAISGTAAGSKKDYFVGKEVYVGDVAGFSVKGTKDGRLGIFVGNADRRGPFLVPSDHVAIEMTAPHVSFFKLAFSMKLGNFGSLVRYEYEWQDRTEEQIQALAAADNAPRKQD